MRPIVIWNRSPIQLWIMLIAVVSIVVTDNTAHAESGSVDSAASLAVTEESQSLATSISDSVMSPYCPGRTLSACPSYQARDLRDKIVGWSTEGQTRDEIEETLVSLYGFEVMGVPSDSATGLLGWYAPLFFVVLGVTALLLKVRSMLRSNSASTAVAHSPELDLKISEIEQQLKQRIKN